MKGILPVLSGFLLLATQSVLVAQTDSTIYYNSLANGWSDASYNCTVNYATTAPTYGSQYSVSAAITGQYGGFGVYNSPMSTSNYSSISFWLNGGASGGQSLEVYGSLGPGNGTQVPQSARYFLSSPASNTWQQYTVSLASLGVENVTNFTGFTIEDSAGLAEPVFYLDDIQLLGSSAPPPPPPQLTVNAGQPLRVAQALWFGIGTPVWDIYLDTPQTVTLLANMGTQALRFPGGSAGDEFHWYNNEPYGSYSNGPPTLASFIQVVTNVNAQTMITLNYGTGSANEAAAWVAYANAATNDQQYLGVDSTGFNWQTAGYWASLRAAAPLASDDGMNFLRISRAAPLGFKNWEIGNEVWGFWETDYNYVPHDPYTYAVRSQGYISLMKAVDPTIKIGVVAVPGVSNYVNNTDHPAADPVTGQVNYGWTPVLLATLNSLNVTPDFLVFHNYPESPGDENDTLLLGGLSAWAANAADLRGQINDYMGANATNVQLICTENNSDVATPGKQSVSLVNGLYKADSLAQLMQTEFAGLFWHDFRDGAIEADGNMSPSLYGWRLFGDFGVATDTDLYPTYYTSELMQHFAHGGDIVISAVTDYSRLSVYAMRRLDGSLTMLTINKDPLNTNTAQISVAGFTPASNAVVYWYGIPQDDAAEFGIGSPDISQTNFSVTGSSFSYSFPPYSATVMALSPALLNGPSTTTVTSSQNPALAGSGVTLTAMVSGSGGIPTGIVLFNDGTNNLGIGTLTGSGTAILTTAALSIGGSPHLITAAYMGDGVFAGSTSSALSQTITNKASVSSNGLSANWPFNEGIGTTVADSSGNGNSGTLFNSPLWVAGLNGSNALQFPGVLVPGAAYVSVPNSATLPDQGIGSNITISGWVKRSSASIANYSAVVAKDTPFDTFPYHRNYELIFDTSGHILFVYRNSVGTSWEIYSSTNVYTDTTNWHFYCVTYTYGSASSCTLYVDGAEVAGTWTSGDGTDAPAATRGGPILIGIDGTGTPSYGSTYQGISIYSVALSAPQVLTLYNSGISTGVATATALASSQNPAPGSSVVTFTATVSGSGGTPSGTVVFFDGNNNLGSETLNSSGIASLSTSALSSSGSLHPIAAVYDGDSTFAASGSSVLPQVFNIGPSTTAISSSQNPAVAGSVVTFTATVTGNAVIPTGTVVFFAGTNNLGNGTLNGSGLASLNTSALSVTGPYSITAVYDGDTNFSGSTSGVLSEIITNGNTSASSNGLSASWPFNEGVGTAAKDSSGNGNTGTLIDSPLWVPGLNGDYALQFPGSLVPGAAYVSVSNSATLADQETGSSLSLCAWVQRSPASLGGYCAVVAKDILNDSAPYHRNYELIFDTAGHILFVYRNSAGTSWEIYSSSATYTDTANWHFYCVTYTYGGASSCALYVDGAPVSGGWISGNGSDAPASTSGGPVLIGIDGTGTASNGSIYDDISIYNAILSAPQVLALYNGGVSGAVASTTTVASSQNPAMADSMVTFTATVSGNGGTPTGTVVFFDGNTSLGNGTLNGSGAASFSTSALSVIGSPHAIKAVYGGDSTFSGGSFSVLSQVITGSSAAVSIPLVNPSFESPAGAQGSVPGEPGGWVASLNDPYGVYNPAVGVYANEASDILPSPAQGSQVLYIQGGNYVAQFLTNTLEPNQVYTLSGALGNRGDGYGLYSSDVDYVCLVVGGTIVSQNVNLPHPIPGTFLPWAISYTTGSAGFPSGTLEIRLGQSGAGQANYDNITLTSATATQVVQAPPVITNQPASQSALAGSAPSFSVAAAGSTPLGFIWYFASTNLVQSGTNYTLTLPGVFTNNAGSYMVVVTNAYGSVTSTVATLTITIPQTPPQISVGDAEFGFLTNKFGFNVSGAFGQTIVVDGSTNLVSWTPLFTNTVFTNPFYFYDAAGTNFPWRFYRARLP